MTTVNKVPSDIMNELTLISTALSNIFAAQRGGTTDTRVNLRSIAKFSGLTTNSVKSVFSGKTANIASYALVAKALGTTLIDVIKTINTTVSTSV